ncbi:V-type ATP synthase subunit D [Porcipelethomonas sp.]|uniref:V-type ATP synthase subunit D n=1 Tax=Porcipelethomonas sp. TaxID=2981675 RepID=UPI003EF28FAC
MAEQVFPTKGNLIKARKTLALCRLGYDLMDRKRNILIREMMQLMDKAKSLRGSIEDTYKEAYAALQDANITLGVIDKIAQSVPVENGISVTYRSVMGVDIPSVTLTRKKTIVPYGFYATNSQLDKAYVSFSKVKDMTVVLAEVENSIYRLATAIKKAQRRANALQNILIPRYEEMVKYIIENLEEKEREEFSRLKVIKSYKIRNKK